MLPGYSLGVAKLLVETLTESLCGSSCTSNLPYDLNMDARVLEAVRKCCFWIENELDSLHVTVEWRPQKMQEGRGFAGFLFILTIG